MRLSHSNSPASDCLKKLGPIDLEYCLLLNVILKFCFGNRLHIKKSSNIDFSNANI